MSFIEKARRAQIVECAIETICNLGFVQASLGQIAKQAGISKGVISYHFSSKDDLIQQVVTEVYTIAASFMQPMIEAETTPKGMLKAYIESNLAFVESHRKHVVAVVEIVTNTRTKDGELRFADDSTQSILNPLIELLRWGEQEGEFRKFSELGIRVLATTIRLAIDDFGVQIIKNPELDTEAYAQELVMLFSLATQASSGS
ncbi:TetR/AcrR family transcriptional regulator [Paenibacillus albidus]|uniref:TetR/AcrR family transcriptional regulator n=1 Tax=Paenibacillus albidus TaxID=2041023 RepID=UPI002035B9B4|nr:TetR/AcrR family transcriptional regulator [Paenibacillus albidus]